MFADVLEKSVFRRFSQLINSHLLDYYILCMSGWHNLIQFHEENIKTIFFLIFPEGYTLNWVTWTYRVTEWDYNDDLKTL